MHLIIAILCLSSCSSNDDDISNPIIGKWKIKDITINNSSILNSCNANSTIEFKPDNTVIVIGFNDDGSCVSESNTGNWKFKSGNTYSTTVNSDDGSFTDISIVFSNNNNTFTTRDSEAQGVVAVYTRQ